MDLLWILEPGRCKKKERKYVKESFGLKVSVKEECAIPTL